ncbi:hypothetical protein [Paracidovorax cattleyae]|uniref:hypothetical protein n=1 Tax=Paracidovorax cattleyae TaxID=80868 RepID=UPI0012603483|nr:hypothetical protein [Paracidovorax cattleyae]
MLEEEIQAPFFLQLGLLAQQQQGGLPHGLVLQEGVEGRVLGPCAVLVAGRPGQLGQRAVHIQQGGRGRAHHLVREHGREAVGLGEGAGLLHEVRKLDVRQQVVQRLFHVAAQLARAVVRPAVPFRAHVALELLEARVVGGAVTARRVDLVAEEKQRAEVRRGMVRHFHGVASVEHAQACAGALRGLHAVAAQRLGELHAGRGAGRDLHPG